ncbi:protein of unknown function [Bradyrhizobium vignae]|uniref:Uncharacterized protein n=1 Tax=Bradyrhizobium vignae TaxID=1549949 RepID=A0A2U3PYQ1_9BRAD|nr:protein of unknown function [Bradyrhizobium vignae]
MKTTIKGRNQQTPNHATRAEKRYLFRLKARGTCNFLNQIVSRPAGAAFATNVASVLEAARGFGLNRGLLR